MPAAKIIAGQKIAGEKLERARQLRHEMTPAETMLWRELRGNRLGPHFRRQQIIAGFIVDFYCHAAGLVIEVDGGVHRGPQQQAGDARRDGVLKDMGLRLVRFRNEDVRTNLPQIMEQIRKLVPGRTPLPALWEASWGLNAW